MKQFAAAIMLALGAMAADLKDQHKPYISAEVRSKDQFQYGRFMTKMQGSDRHGTIATFMTLFLGDEQEKMSVENWNHINLELVPHAFNKVTTNLIWKNFTNEWDKVKNFDPSNNWHEYDIRWTPEHITFIIDGIERRREVHTDDDFNEALDDINKKHHIIMNFWTPDWCAEHLESDESMPWYTRYEYVKAYDYKGKDANGEDIFEMRWQEDFDGTSLDTDRWATGTHSIGGSTTTFVPQNAYLEEGKLVLKMENVNGQPRRDDDDDDEQKKPEEPDHGHGDADWQVLPAPQKGSLDAAIEMSVRVGVTMVRTALDSWSEEMWHYLQ